MERIGYNHLCIAKPPQPLFHRYLNPLFQGSCSIIHPRPDMERMTIPCGGNSIYNRLLIRIFIQQINKQISCKWFCIALLD